MRARGALIALCLGAGAAAAEPCENPQMLGQVALQPADCGGVTAYYEEPTGRYPHGVLGDDEEWVTLVAQQERTKLKLRLPVTRVFEDLAPRLVELDGTDGPEILVVESDHKGGGTLVVYDVDFSLVRPQIERWAATLPIGTRFRWLAPVGVADFDGDGQADIAYVETPHLGKTLRIVTPREGRLDEIAAAAGFSNHRIGEAFITGGVRDCGPGPEAVTPSGDWTRLLAARLAGDDVAVTDLGPFEGPESVAAALACAGS